MTTADAAALLEMADEWDRRYRVLDAGTHAWVDAAAQLRTKVVTLGEDAR